MKRVHIVGRKNSGKTTLVADLVEEFARLGLRVGTIKHTHHQHELDTPGKDSFRHREAGADVVGILSRSMNAIFWASSGETTSSDNDRYDQFAPMFASCDLVLVEGGSQSKGCKIEVWRATTASTPLAADDRSIVAIVTDDHVDVDVQVWPRSDVGRLAREVISLMRK